MAHVLCIILSLPCCVVNPDSELPGIQIKSVQYVFQCGQDNDRERAMKMMRLIKRGIEVRQKAEETLFTDSLVCYVLNTVLYSKSSSEWVVPISNLQTEQQKPSRQWKRFELRFLSNKKIWQTVRKEDNKRLCCSLTESVEAKLNTSLISNTSHQTS